MSTRARRPEAEWVLVVEDHPINQRVATVMLEHLGFQVEVVGDGAEAVNAAARRHYRAILMDCEVPVLDGYDATVAIRRLPGPAAHTPIVAVTASDSDADESRALAAGMDAFLVKPLTLNALGAAIARGAPARRDAANLVIDLESAESGRPVLDALVVGRLERLGVAAGEDLVEQLATLFLSDADDRVAAVRDAIAGRDGARVAQSAHTLSGAAANVGAVGLALVCATLETAGAEDDLMSAATLIDAVATELERVRLALGAWLPGAASETRR
jgi:CheY-like chemotaxis protein/HPt (histidine-containing phosphotransfer) domain-containing protein